jgi:hypothetical protein
VTEGFVAKVRQWWTLLEEMSWRQQSKALWLKEGDKCTKFFHRVANANRRNNFIEPLLVNGSISSDQTEIRDHIVNFYDKLIIEQFYWRPKLDGLAFDSIDEEEDLTRETI